MPWRICGKVIAGVHFFPPLGFPYQEPRGQERKCLMMLPTRPMAYLIVRQTGFALTALNTLFDPMGSFGHPGQLPQRRLRRRVRQVIIHLYHLCLVSVTGADDHQQLLVALLTPMGSGHHTACDHLDHQRSFAPIAHGDAPPGIIAQRCGPRGHALPGTLRRALASPGRASLCSMVPPAYSVHPTPPADDETRQGGPSRRLQQSSDAEERHRFSPTSPRPTGDAYDRHGTLSAPPLCPDALYPWSILWAGTAACPPDSGPFGTHSPGKWPLDSCRLCPAGRTTAGLPPPTPDRTWETPRDRTPTPHRLVPSGS